ncbi:MAG: hypothetical protein Satyrvirus1_47 [Satyrvirus sp.]|uniref:Uncharacterized protein n=1 Tax=Satyrvirus sp. TaxID=2487771 RepID=A0A3G5AFA8_9VIRU|nr:MAG: hypothetical protein Satyrvirus1_47 [Satyrvirus sp.]
MCIIADSVKDVSKTKIASFHVSYTYDGRIFTLAQLVVYAANVDSMTNTNAFILPVYNPGNNLKNIIPLDLSNVPEFFDDVKEIFNKWDDTYERPLGIINDSFGSLLDVYRVGNYKFSMMPSKKDFSRIDKKYLNINPMAKISIDVHSDDYSFIVFQFFQKGKLEITPFGYLCKPYKDYAMIIPTIHGHPHNDLVDPFYDSSYSSLYAPFQPLNTNHRSSFEQSSFENSANFDHDVYSLVRNLTNKNITTQRDIEDISVLLKKINKDYMNKNIKIYPPKSFIPTKISIKGYYKNRNLLINTNKYSFIEDLIF